MSYILRGASAVCECCRLPLYISVCGWQEKPTVPLVLSKPVLHQLFAEASSLVWQKCNWNYTPAVRQGKKLLRCIYCNGKKGDALYWFDAGSGYVGGTCEYCTRRSLTELGHEEDGAVEKVPIIAVPASARMILILERYKEARTKARTQHEADTASPEVLPEGASPLIF